MKRMTAAFVAAIAMAIPAAAADDLPAGTYKLDKHHASLTFTVSHLGFSNYTAQFTVFDATLELDPKNPASAKLEATIDPTSLDLPSPPDGFKDELTGPNWLDAAKFPQMTFKSTSVEPTGDKTAKVTGDFTLHGVTKPVTLEVMFNGGYPGLAGIDPNARIGFSAKGVLKRSEFGIAYGVPAPGTTMGVSDEVQIAIEAEMSGPPLAEAK